MVVEPTKYPVNLKDDAAMSAAALALQRIDGAIRRTDRVVLATAGLFAALAAVAPDQALSSLVFTPRLPWWVKSFSEE